MGTMSRQQHIEMYNKKRQLIITINGHNPDFQELCKMFKTHLQSHEAEGEEIKSKGIYKHNVKI